MTEEELSLLEEILNEELLSYADSGFKITEDCVVQVRSILKKLNLKEIYNFERKFRTNEWRRIIRKDK